VTGLADLLEPLDGKSPTLYLVAGAMLAVFAASTGARVFADVNVEALHSTLGPGGFFVGFVGLFGLYPALAADSPRLARVAAAVAALPLVGWFVIAAAGVGSAAGVLPGASAILPGPVLVLVFPATILAYLLFAATSLRTGVPSRTVGVLLLAPAATFLVLLVGVAVAPSTGSLEFVVDGGHALGHLAIGAALWTGADPAGRADTAADPTA
jgi:hypothetical protein